MSHLSLVGYSMGGLIQRWVAGCDLCSEHSWSCGVCPHVHLTPSHARHGPTTGTWQAGCTPWAGSQVAVEAAQAQARRQTAGPA